MINRIIYILITACIASACVSTDSQIADTSVCQNFESSIHLDLRRLNLIDVGKKLTSKPCYIVALDTSGSDSILNIHFCDITNTTMKVQPFNDLLISKIFIEPKNSYVNEEILYVFGHRKGTLRYDLSINGNEVWLTGVTIFNGNQERFYLISENNQYSLINNYERTILNTPLERLLSLGQPPILFRYKVIGNELHKVSIMKSDSIVPIGNYNLAECHKYIDENENLFIAAFCSGHIWR